MSSVYDMSEVEFKEVLAVKTTASEIFANAPEIYDFLSGLFGESCEDSLLREWAFQYYAEATGNKYDEIYKRWLGL